MFTTQYQRYQGTAGHQRRSGHIRPGGSLPTKPRGAVSNAECPKGLNFPTMQKDTLQDGEADWLVETWQRHCCGKDLRVAIGSLPVITFITNHGAQVK